MQAWLVAGLCAAGVAGGCARRVRPPRLPPGRDCLTIVQWGVVVAVLDAGTGTPLAGGAAGTVRDGAFVDTLRVMTWEVVGPDPTPTALGAAHGRAGVYTVRVTRPGYVPYERRGVRVRAGACTVETARLTARLVPRP